MPSAQYSKLAGHEGVSQPPPWLGQSVTGNTAHHSWLLVGWNYKKNWLCCFKKDHSSLFIQFWGHGIRLGAPSSCQRPHSVSLPLWSFLVFRCLRTQNTLTHLQGQWLHKAHLDIEPRWVAVLSQASRLSTLEIWHYLQRWQSKLPQDFHISEWSPAFFIKLVSSQNIYMRLHSVIGTDLDHTDELNHNVKTPCLHPATHHSQHQIPLGHQPQVFQSLNRHLPTRQRI